MAASRSLLTALLAKFPDTPKSRAKDWIVSGRVSVNGVVIRKPHFVVSDEISDIALAGKKAGGLDCDNGWRIHARVTLVYLDASFAIINKGPAIISVPSAEPGISALSVLQDFLDGNLQPRDHRVSVKDIPPPYRRLTLLPVHRLDQYTTGLLAFATNAHARRNLIEQLNAQKIEREYIAFTFGHLSQKRGTWRDRVFLSPDEMRQTILPENEGSLEAVEAITQFEVLDEFLTKSGAHPFSKLKLRLETGRKHQIRAQAAHAGVPLVGDRVYNPQYRQPELPEEVREFSRQALHAATLSLEHPEQQGKRMHWSAPLPDDMRDLERGLRTL